MAHIKVRDEIEHLVKTIGADPTGFTVEEFRTLLLKINMGISKGATRKLFAQINGNGDKFCSAGEVLNFLRPWRYEYPNHGAYKLLREVLFQTYHGRKPPPKPKRKSLKRLKARTNVSEREALRILLDAPPSAIEYTFEFPNYRDSLLPRTVELEIQQHFTLPMKFSEFIHYFGTSDCPYSAVDHARMAGFDEPKVTPWTGTPETWANRTFSCSTTFENVPSFIPIRTTNLRVHQRVKFITPGAIILHFRTELLDGPFSKTQYYHEVWEIREIFGKCKVTYFNGMQWLQHSWFTKPIKKCACTGGTESTLFYVQIISEKYHILKNDPTQNVRPPNLSERTPPKTTRRKLLAAYASFTLISLLVVILILTYFNLHYTSFSLLISYLVLTAITKIKPSLCPSLALLTY